MPKKNLTIFHRDPDQSKSLLYFGHIATFDVAAYKARVRERYTPPEGASATEAYLDDLAVQIAVNSKIANRKFTLFNVGAGFVIAAMIVLAAPLVPPLAKWIVSSFDGRV